MKAMVSNKIAPVNKHSLTLRDVPVPIPGKGEILVKVMACGIC